MRSLILLVFTFVSSVSLGQDSEVERALASLSDPGGYGRASAQLERSLDELLAANPDAEPDRVVEIDAHRRLMSQLAVLDAQAAERAWAVLERQDELARALAYLLTDKDDVPAAYRVLERLIAGEGEDAVGSAPGLAAAVCAVFDQPRPKRLNENTARGVEPEEVFGYFLRSGRRLQMDPSKTPAEMLVYVVSVTDPIGDLAWAQKRYGRQRNHEQRYFEIQYDHGHFVSGQPKQVTQAQDYRLRTIKEFGGVCIDQAYFAEQVAKANGVPAVIVTGRSGEVGHAWLGFYRAAGRSASWDFDAGCYPDYRKIRGVAVDPRTHERVTQGELDMVALTAREVAVDRRAAVALVDAASRMEDASARLALLERAAGLSPAESRVWRAFAGLAIEGHASQEDIERWLVAFDRSQGKRSRDVLADLLDLIDTSLKDADQRVALWEWGIDRFRGRSDLEAFARERQAKAFLDAGDRGNAWRAYEDVVKRFLDDGPFAVDAVMAQAEMLEREKGGRGVSELLGRAWARLEPPKSQAIEFFRQSNWFRLGTRYHEALLAEGRSEQAAQVLAALRSGRGGPGTGGR